MKLNVLVKFLNNILLFMNVRVTERICDVDEAHARFGVPRVVVDDEINGVQVSDFVISLNGIEEGFLPEIEYEVSLKSIGDPFQEYIVTAQNDDLNCEHGTMIDKFGIGTIEKACPHSIRHTMITDMRTVSFNWKAPRCGCVTIRASLKTDGIVYSEASFEKGTLLKEVCVTGMNKPDEFEGQFRMGDDEELDEEPFYDEELYDNIERLCEEGNFRGKFLPGIIRECCVLPIHQRRMCLIRFIPAQEADVHRIDAFCTQVAGDFFEGHPALSNDEGVRRCCELIGNSTRMACLAEEKRMHYDEICALISDAMNDTESLPGPDCCSLDGDFRYKCMYAKVLRESIKRKAEERRALRRQAEKVKRLCNAVDQAPEGDRDSEDYQPCCKIEDVGNALECFKEVEMSKFDGLCSRQAFRYENGLTERVHACCSMENDTRYECFLERRPSWERIQGSDSNNPTWMQRTCARLRSDDGDKVLRTCCRKSSYILKKKCMDDRFNRILTNVCNASNEDTSYAIVEGENGTAPEQNLNPEHECCTLEENERLACIKKMRIVITKNKRDEIKRKYSVAKGKRVEASREQKGQRWVQEEIRQNEVICGQVREQVDMVNEQVVRCCEMDSENQQECLAVLRRNHFTAVCNTDSLFQMDIFNTVLRTEDPINDDHRCCMRPNADIRAACFSRVERQVAMLSYSPPVVEEVQDIQTELLAVAEFNRIDSVCQEMASATSRELRGRWPAKKCCRYRNNRKYTCLMDAARKQADQSCDGPPPRVYFPVGFYGEYISSDYTGVFLDPTHPCCSLTGDMRQQCISDASMAVLALRVPILAETPLDEFFKVMPSEMRFDADHQDAICQAATSFQDFYADLENGLDVELNQPALIQAELQELQELLAEELTEEEEDQAEMMAEQEEERQEMLEEQAQVLAEQIPDNLNEEEEEEEEEEDNEDDRRRKRRQAAKFLRPTSRKVKASAGSSIYEVDSLVYCCRENILTETKTCMTTLWLQLLNEACQALPYLPTSSNDLQPVSEGAQGNTNLLAPAPLKFGSRGDIQTSESTVSQNSDEEDFLMCCSLFGQEQLECFQAHYSPDVLSSLIKSEGSSIPLTGGSELVGSESESGAQENIESESEGSDGEEMEESEGEEPQEQMGSEGQESEGSDGEEEEESEGEEPQEQIGSDGEENEVIDEEEIEESEGVGEPQDQMESEGSDGEEDEESEGEEPQEQTGSDGEENEAIDEEEIEESEGEGEPQDQMESDGSDGEEDEESEGEEPQEQIGSNGEENEAIDEEEIEESEGVGEPQNQMESEESDGEEDEESEGEEPQEQIGSDGEENEAIDEEEIEESEGVGEPQDQMESEGSDGEEEEESEVEELQEQIGSEGQEIEGLDEEEMGESEGMESQDQMESEGQVIEGSDGEEEDNSGEVSEGYMPEGSDSDMPEPGSSAGTSDVPLGIQDNKGQTYDPEEVGEPEMEMGSEGQQDFVENQELEQTEEVTEEPEDPEEEAEESEVPIIDEVQETEEETGGWFWWSGKNKPQQQAQSVVEVEEEEEEEEDDDRRKRDLWGAYGIEESEGEEEPQEQMESEGQESEAQEQQNEEGEEEEEEEEEDDRRRRRRDILGTTEEPEGSDGEEETHGETESEGQESEAQEQTGWWWNWMTDNNEPQTQEQNGGEEGEEEEEEEEEDDDRRRRDIWDAIWGDNEEPEESEGVEEPQEQIQSEGQESEAQEQQNEEEEAEEEEEEEEDEEEDRKRRDIWSAMELLSNIENKQQSNSHSDSQMRNPYKGASRHHSGRAFGKLSLLKLLFKSEMIDDVCPAVEAADSVRSVIASLFEKTPRSHEDGAYKKKYSSRESDEMFLQLQECCALNTTDETAECLTDMAMTIVDGICDLQEGGFRPRPAHAKGQAWAKKRLFRGCCYETGEQRYTCAKGYLAPSDEIQEIVDMVDEHDDGLREMDPIDLFRNVGHAVGKLLSLNDQDEDDDQPEIIDQETTMAPSLL